MIRPLLWLPLAALSLYALPAHAQEASLEKQVRKLHQLAGGQECARPEGAYLPEDEYESWTFSYQPGWSESADAETVTLIRVFCFAGAYNVSHAYYIERDFEGLMPLAFAEPSYDAVYEEGVDIDTPLESLTQTGIGATTILVNSDFDPETRTITAHALWRGLGDASSDGTWSFKGGQFVLTHYAVDASYDGEMNPQVLVDYSQ